MTDISKKSQIYNAAARLFRKKGYKATSMQDIANALDIKAASLYNHISSKQEILKFLLINIADAFTSGMKDIEESSLDDIEKLEQLVILHVDLTLRYKDSIALITGEWVHLENPYLDQYLKQRNQYEKRFLTILKRCQKHSHIDAKINLDIALFSILSSLHWLYNWYNKNKSISKIELSRQLKLILLKGIINI